MLSPISRWNRDWTLDSKLEGSNEYYVRNDAKYRMEDGMESLSNSFGRKMENEKASVEGVKMIGRRRERMENFFLDEYTRRTNELYSVLGLPWSFGGTKWTRGVVSRGV